MVVWGAGMLATRAHRLAGAFHRTAHGRHRHVFFRRNRGHRRARAGHLFRWRALHRRSRFRFYPVAFLWRATPATLAGLILAIALVVLGRRWKLPRAQRQIVLGLLHRRRRLHLAHDPGGQEVRPLSHARLPCSRASTQSRPEIRRHRRARERSAVHARRPQSDASNRNRRPGTGEDGAEETAEPPSAGSPAPLFIGRALMYPNIGEPIVRGTGSESPFSSPCYGDATGASATVELLKDGACHRGHAARVAEGRRRSCGARGQAPSTASRRWLPAAESGSTRSSASCHGPHSWCRTEAPASGCHRAGWGSGVMPPLPRRPSRRAAARCAHQRRARPGGLCGRSRATCDRTGGRAGTARSGPRTRRETICGAACSSSRSPAEPARCAAERPVAPYGGAQSACCARESQAASIPGRPRSGCPRSSRGSRGACKEHAPEAFQPLRSLAGRRGARAEVP